MLKNKPDLLGRMDQEQTWPVAAARRIGSADAKLRRVRSVGFAVQDGGSRPL
jgi:hypothetical protein